MTEKAVIKEVKKIKGKAKKYSKKYGMLIPLVGIPAADQWESVLYRLDLYGFKIAKKGKKK